MKLSRLALLDDTARRYNTVFVTDMILFLIFLFTGVKPYACSECDRSFTQRCSLESHCRKVHNMDINYAYKQRRNKIYVCEECGHSTADASKHFLHLRENHPNNPALMKCHDRRQFKFHGGETTTQQNVHLPRTWWGEKDLLFRHVVT